MQRYGTALDVPTSLRMKPPISIDIHNILAITHLPMAFLVKRNYSIKVPLRGIEGALSCNIF
jgi:hypothetical protein